MTGWRPRGVIQARRGSGFYVAGHLPPLALADLGPVLDRAIDPFWVSRRSLESGEAILKPGCGWLPASWMPEEGLRRALRSPVPRRYLDVGPTTKRHWGSRAFASFSRIAWRSAESTPIPTRSS